MRPADPLPLAQSAPYGAPAPDSPAAAQSNGQYIEPWLMRVVDVDEGTLDVLVRQLISMRRIRFGLTVVATVLGSCALGVITTPDWLYTLMIYATLGFTAGMPAWGIGTLCIRRLFLKEAERHGLRRSAAMLTLVRAERKARHVPFFASNDVRARLLTGAVKGWDDAALETGAIG